MGTFTLFEDFCQQDWTLLSCNSHSKGKRQHERDIPIDVDDGKHWTCITPWLKWRRCLGRHGRRSELPGAADTVGHPREFPGPCRLRPPHLATANTSEIALEDEILCIQGCISPVGADSPARSSRGIVTAALDASDETAALPRHSASLHRFPPRKTAWTRDRTVRPGCGSTVTANSPTNGKDMAGADASSSLPFRA
jgi:hypothetical protein